MSNPNERQLLSIAMLTASIQSDCANIADHEGQQDEEAKASWPKWLPSVLSQQAQAQNSEQATARRR